MCCGDSLEGGELRPGPAEGSTGGAGAGGRMEEVSCAGDDVMQLGWMETSHVGFSCRADGSAEMKESRVTTHTIHGCRRSSFATDENGPGNVAGSRVTLPGKERRKEGNETKGKGSEERRGASEGAPAAQRGRESERGRSADDEEARHEEVARSLARSLVRSLFWCGADYRIGVNLIAVCLFARCAQQHTVREEGGFFLW